MDRVTRILFLSMIFAVVSCASPDKPKADSEAAKNDTAQAKESWPEMDNFHSIMADSFHPFMDGKDLGPAKAHADEMAIAAEKWASAPLPKKVDNQSVRGMLTQLQTSTKEFVTIARDGDDEAVGTALTALHDLFHKLQDSWYHGGEGEEHEH